MIAARARWVFLVVLSFLAAPVHAAIHYTVSVEHPERHRFHVTMDIPDVSGEVIVAMPAWNALYQIRDFAMHVQRVDASVEGKPVPIEKLDKQTWRITATGNVSVHYDTFWDDGGPFGTELNADSAFINPAMICMYVPNRRNEEVWVSLSDLPYGWGADSGAPFRSKSGFGRVVLFMFGAPSYDEMTDAPIQAGKVERFEVPDAQPPVHVVVLGDQWRKKVLQEELRRIVAYEVKLMEGAPYKEDTFLLRFRRGRRDGAHEFHRDIRTVGRRVRQPRSA